MGWVRERRQERELDIREPVGCVVVDRPIERPEVATVPDEMAIAMMDGSAADAEGHTHSVGLGLRVDVIPFDLSTTRARVDRIAGWHGERDPLEDRQNQP